jgi:hypothetical protein
MCDTVCVPLPAALSPIFSARIDAALLSNFNAERHLDTYFNTTAVSALDPRDVGGDALVRWVSTPMWIGGRAAGGKPDGAPSCSCSCSYSCSCSLS